MNKKLFIAILVLVFTTILILSIVIAAEDLRDTSKEMNYGKCVSQKSKEQTTCLNEARREFNNLSQSLKKISRNESSNKTEVKEKQEEYREKYKNNTENCKTIFKINKEMCKQYKCKNTELFNTTSFKCYQIQINNTNFTNNSLPFLELEKQFCDENSTKVDKKICATYYHPVCGWYNSHKAGDNRQYKITYTNSCFACRDQKIEFWTEGRC